MGHNIIRQYKSNELYYFSDAEKELIIKEYLSYPTTKQAIWEKYTGRKKENGLIVKWMRRLGYDVNGCQRRVISLQKGYLCQNVAFIAWKVAMPKLKNWRFG
ncbi:MAG: hypothetical protein IPJ81_19575 [Chitinophagaceae bacterium]|nr:hypothetical protein [Chitinophagaceae bacterium]